MTPDEREEMFALCAEIAKETKHARFLKLVQRLNDLLANQESRLEPSGPAAELDSE
jgi:hypothetical protein